MLSLGADFTGFGHPVSREMDTPFRRKWPPCFAGNGHPLVRSPGWHPTTRAALEKVCARQESGVRVPTGDRGEFRLREPKSG